MGEPERSEDESFYISGLSEGDRRETGGAWTSWVFSRLISDRGWGRGMDFEVGENRRRGRGSRHGPHGDQPA